MTTELVRYSNTLNELNFHNLKATELNLFMSLCLKIKDKNTQLLKISFKELKELTAYKGKDEKKFVANLRDMSRKLSKIDATCINNQGFALFVLFPTFFINEEEKTLTIRVNPDFTFLFNQLYKDFTKFELTEFVALKNKYSKNLYRLLKQFRKSGFFVIKFDKLRDKLDCPQNYSNSEFTRSCLDKAVKELESSYFQNLSYEVDYDKDKPGSPSKLVKFYFKADFVE